MAHRLVPQISVVSWILVDPCGPTTGPGGEPTAPEEQAYSMSHSGGLCSYGLLLLGDLEGPGSLDGENGEHVYASTGDDWSYSMISMKDPPLKESH